MATAGATTLLAAQTPQKVVTPGLLRNRSFDGTFVAGTLLLGLAAGVAVLLDARLFIPILVADVWLLGYHHVISTYTRIAMDADSLRKYRALLLWVPLPVVVVVVGLVFLVGAWTIPTVYLYWQWWHYTRQSYGVAALYRRKSSLGPIDFEGKALLYLLPVAGILWRSAQSPHLFLGLELRTVPIPTELAWGVLALAGVSVAVWVVRQVSSWRAVPESRAHSLYLASHLLVFFVGYIGTESIDHGWLVINIWHNAQYVMIVWLFNNNRFKNQVDVSHRFLSTLSQRRYLIAYLVFCLALSTTAYLMVGSFTAMLAAALAPAALIVYQSINFHHYIVDSVIWKVRKPEIGANLGVAAAPERSMTTR